MKKDLFFIVWIVLVGLTVTTALITKINFEYIAALILIVSFFKFVGISFYFMELRKAHVLWKVALLSFLTLFIIVILIVK